VHNIGINVGERDQFARGLGWVRQYHSVIASFGLVDVDGPFLRGRALYRGSAEDVVYS